ncbi:hypothetical protein Anas_11795, partial [Armadillidium nasatum]
NHQIFLGTPEIVANYHKRLLTSSTRGALIIEDISAILEDAENRLYLLSILERLKLSNKTSKMNVVFVSRFEDPHLTDHLSRMIGINVVKLNESSVSDIPEALKTQEENPSVNKGKEERTNHASDELKNQFVQETSFTPSPTPKRPHTSSEDYLLRKSVKTHSEISTRAYVIDQASFKYQAPQDHLSLPHSNFPVSVEENKKHHGEDSHSNTFQSELHFSSDKYDSKNKTLIKKLPEAELNLRSTLGEELYKSFAQERKEILSSHESEYDAYKTFPDLHPNYDKYYSEFLKDYVKKYPIHKSEDHKASVWKEHWKSKLKAVMDDEWKEQKKKLFLKYQNKVEKESQENLMKLQVPLSVNDPRTNLSDSSQSRTNDNRIEEVDKIDNKSLVEEDEFTVEKSLDFLEQFSPKFGVLGPSMLAMVESTRKLGSNTFEALNIFTEEENVALINMGISKLKALQQKSSELDPVLTCAINFITQLLEYAKSPPLHLILDIKSIARCTLGQSPTCILDKINKILTRKKRANESKEKINELFLKVCAVQFDLQTSSND